MPICTRDDCDDDAIAVQLVRLDPPELRREHCRPHHVEERRAAGVLVAAEVVTNRAPIMSVDGTENRRGAQIALDSEEIDIQLLVDLGYIKVIGPVAPVTAAAAKSSSAKPAASEG
jgi:hypothetical protein